MLVFMHEIVIVFHKIKLLTTERTKPLFIQEDLLPSSGLGILRTRYDDPCPY